MSIYNPCKSAEDIGIYQASGPSDLSLGTGAAAKPGLKVGGMIGVNRFLMDFVMGIPKISKTHHWYTIRSVPCPSFNPQHAPVAYSADRGPIQSGKLPVNLHGYPVKTFHEQTYDLLLHSLAA